ncbi:hypothetical protein EVG20_g1156 [Dentipellis fragilis]|uniref:Uncharacterized protein n=1 Tax=Dentipellis fragilis TaxID=205917 RepID=A0A4Y9ZDE6_9AGAM|nr:hypothetical protein EVG20_g1156 [Dentipellis fragilis]
MPPRSKKASVTSKATLEAKAAVPPAKAPASTPAPTSKGVKRAAEALDVAGSAPKKPRVKLIVLEENDEEEDEAEQTDPELGTDEDSASDSEDGELSPSMQSRLDNLGSMVSGLTDTFLRMITSELPGYMGPRGGGNAMVADCILGYLEHEARNGSNLREEKELVKSVYAMCYGSCGADSDEDSDDDSESAEDEDRGDGDEDEVEDEDKGKGTDDGVGADGIPKKVKVGPRFLRITEGDSLTLTTAYQARRDELSAMVGGLTKSYLKDVMKGLPAYGGSGGTNAMMQDSIVEYLEEEARSGSNLNVEARVIEEVHRECYGPGCGEDFDY